MTLAAGTRLGPYEILAPLGAGGMGEVYRARDPRLGRDVAIKVLPAAFSADADRLRRFEQEARAAGALNHPEHPRRLRRRARTTARPTSSRSCSRARRCASGSAASALPAAQGHRLRDPDRARPGRRPREGHRPPRPQAREPLRHARRARQDPRLRPGQADGARGRDRPRDADRRRDGDPGPAPGIVLGHGRLHVARAGRGPARRPALRHLLLRRDPLRDAVRPARVPRRLRRRDDDRDPEGGPAGPLAARTRTSRPRLERIVRHCLEKNPEERFQSARDLAFDLEALSGQSALAVLAAPEPRRPGPMAEARGRRPGRGPDRGRVLRRRHAGGRERRRPEFKPLTFRRGSIDAARFAPDGRTIVYARAVGGEAVRRSSLPSPAVPNRGRSISGRVPERDLALRRDGSGPAATSQARTDAGPRPAWAAARRGTSSTT